MKWSLQLFLNDVAFVCADFLLLLLLLLLLQAVDFSRDILSLMHGELHIAAYPFHGYWEDVGSLKDYYAANMAMAADVSSGGWVGEKGGVWHGLVSPTDEGAAGGGVGGCG